MRHLANLALGVAVITGWTLALVWVAASISQIAVDRVIVPSVCVSAAGGTTCAR